MLRTNNKFPQSFLTANATVTVQVLNRAPQAIPIAKTVPKNSPKFQVDIFSYIGDNGERISDIDNDVLFVTGFSDNKIVSVGSSSQLGLVQVDKFTGFYYTPSPNFNGVEQFNYAISDGNDTSTSTVTLTIANNPPVAVDDVYRVPKYRSAVLNVLSNDYDINGDNITLTRALGASYGAVSVSKDKLTVFYTTSSVMTTKYGDSFEYSITDGNAESSAVVFVQVYNNPPQVFGQTVNVAKSSVNNNIPIIYYDPDEKDLVTLTKVSPSLPQGSIKATKTYAVKYFECCDYINVEINNYTIVFTPTPNTVYTTSFDITMNDGEADGSGKITVNVVNTPPVAVDDNASCGKNLQTLINVVANDYDNDAGDTALIKLTTDSWTTATQLGGSVTLFNDTHVLYVAPTGKVGQTDVATYRITDQSKTSSGFPDPTSFATGKIYINLVNNPPTPADDTFTIPKGKSTVLNVLANDADPNDGPSSVRVINSVDASSKKNILPSILRNQIGGNKDALSYAAVNQEYTDSFTYDVTDQDGMTSTYKAIVTLNVVNTAPVAADDSFSTLWNRGVDCNVKANDQDENGDLPSSTIQVTTLPGHGTAIVVGDIVRYTPANGYVGPDSFQYQLNDGSSSNALSNVATVTINVINNAPVTVSDSVTTHWNNPTGVVISPLVNDNDPDGDALSVSAVSSDPATVGTATLVDSQTVRFVPSTSKPITIGSNVKQFTYTASDSNKQTIGTIFVTLTNNKPVPSDDTFTLHWSAPATVLDVLKNDVDADGDSLTVSSVDTTATSGSAVVTSGSGSVTYTPNKSFMGVTDQFKYTVNDGAQDSANQGTVTIQLTNNDKPTASDVSYSVHWRVLQNAGGYQDFDVLSGKTTDNDGDSLSVSVVTSSSCSVVNNKVRVTVASGSAIGPTSCSFTVTDGHDSVTKTATVITFNTDPTCSDITVSFDPNNFATGQKIAVTSFVNDLDAADVSFLMPTQLGGIQVGDSLTVVTSDRSLLFKPAQTVSTRHMTYKVTDGVVNSASCALTVDVSSTSPSAYTKSVSVHWNSANNQIDIFSAIPTSTYQTIYPGYSATSITYNSGNKMIYYTPKKAVGFDKFIVGIKDSLNTPQNVTVSVTIYNNAPSASVPQASVVWSSTGIDIDLLVAYSDADMTAGYEPLGTVTSLDTTGCKGSVTLKADKRTATFVPQGTFTGLTQFKATATDGIATTTFTVSVQVTNQAPVTQPKTATISWSQHKAGYTINVLNYGGKVDTDADGNALTASLTSGVSPSTAGSVVLSASPNALVNAGSSVYLGSFSFSYAASDSVTSTPGSVTVTVTNTLPSPSPVNTNAHWRSSGITLDPVVSYAPTRKDSDGDSLTITAASASKGTAVANTNTITYTAPSVLGLDVVSYTLSDGAQTVSNANTVVNVNVFNTNPNAASLNINTVWSKSTTKDLTGACTDTDPLDASYVRFTGTVSNAVGGTTSVSGNMLTFTPNLAASSYSLSGNVYTGSGSFQYTCTDGMGTTTGPVSVTITNNAPTGTGASISIARDYTKTTYDFTFAQMGTFSDADGDIISVIKVATTSDVTVTTTATGIRLTTSQTVQGAKAITFKLFDGLHESVNTLTFTVTFTNAAPTCVAATFNVNKGQSVDLLPTLKLQTSDANNDQLTINLAGSVPSTLGTLSGTTFTASSTKSGTSTALTFSVSDTQLSNSCVITINVINAAPTAQNDVWAIASSSQLTYTYSYTKFSDSDTADILTVTKVSDTCSSIATSVTISTAGLITFNRQSSVTAGSCTLNVKVTDSDNNPLSATATITIGLSSQTPVARNDRFSINQGQTIRIYVSQMLANDTDEFGSSSSLTFVGFSCPDSTYCHRTPRQINVNGQVAIEVDSDPLTCQADKFRYTMQTSFGVQKSADVFIEFKNCYCTAKIDFVFLIDASGSIGTDNFNNIRTFLKSITGRFKLGIDAIQVGIVKFHDDNTIALELSTDGTAINNTLTNMAYDAGSTAQISGLRGALQVLRKGRPDAAKVIYILTDGMANVPCK